MHNVVELDCGKSSVINMITRSQAAIMTATGGMFDMSLPLYETLEYRWVPEGDMEYIAMERATICLYHFLRVGG